MRSAAPVAPLGGEGAATQLQSKAPIQRVGDEDEKASAGASSKAKAAWEKRKQNYIDAIAAANQAIENLDAKMKDYFEGRLDVPANARALIAGLEETTKPMLSRDLTRIANFNDLVMDHFKSKKKKLATPEMQTALVQDSSTDAYSLRISGNTKSANKKLKQMFEGKTPEAAYEGGLKDTLVEQEVAEMEKVYKGLTAGEVNQIPVRDNPFASFSFDSSKSMWAAGPLELTDDKFVFEFKAGLTKTVASKAKRSTRVKKGKSARAMVRRKSKAAYHDKMGSLSTHVPTNAENYHAEVAILKELLNEVNMAMKLVGGTKVACTACQAVFHEEGHGEMMSGETSFAWLSKSSVEQLGLEGSNVEGYLARLYNVLNDLVQKKELTFYGGSDKAGTIADTEMEFETDNEGYDSVDESAVNLFQKRVDNKLEFRPEVSMENKRHPNKRRKVE